MSRRDLAAVWTVLESEADPDAVEAVGTGYRVVAGEVLAGVSSGGRRYLLIPLLPGEAVRVDIRGRAVHITRVQLDRTHYVALVCFSPELYSVFTQFSRELMESLRESDSPARAACEAFDRWRALFSDAPSRDAIAEQALIGIMGELLTLESLLALGAPGSLEYWRGPSGDIHDFRTAECAFEVKTTLVRDGRFVSVSGIDQLQAPPGATLFLIHHRLDRDPAGLSLPGLVRQVTSLGASYMEISNKLSQAGVSVTDLATYEERRYRPTQTRMYDVTDATFPRITRKSFADRDIPPGTLRISYVIDLTNEPPRPLGTDDAQTCLQEMAMEALDGMGS